MSKGISVHILNLTKLAKLTQSQCFISRQDLFHDLLPAKTTQVQLLRWSCRNITRKRIIYCGDKGVEMSKNLFFLS